MIGIYLSLILILKKKKEYPLLELKITDYTIDELCDAIENQRHDYICLNDPEEEIDFYKLSERLRKSFEKILPDKSCFER